MSAVARLAVPSVSSIWAVEDVASPGVFAPASQPPILGPSDNNDKDDDHNDDNNDDIDNDNGNDDKDDCHLVRSVWDKLRPSTARPGTELEFGLKWVELLHCGVLLCGEFYLRLWLWS